MQLSFVWDPLVVNSTLFALYRYGCDLGKCENDLDVIRRFSTNESTPVTLPVLGSSQPQKWKVKR